MRVLVLKGSPRRRGNTAALVEPLVAELEGQGHEVRAVELSGRRIRGCVECFRCQEVLDAPGCGLKDDMEELFPELLAAEVLVFAAPIFTWFCPVEMKALMDRLFCLSKTYNELPEKPRLLAGKRLALVSTYGAERSTGPDLLETALRRECDYAGMTFAGHLGVQDVNGREDFISEESVSQAKAFAKSLA